MTGNSVEEYDDIMLAPVSDLVVQVDDDLVYGPPLRGWSLTLQRLPVAHSVVLNLLKSVHSISLV